MKFSYLSSIAIMILVIGVAFAGCASNSTPTPATGTPAPGSAATQAPAPVITTSAAVSSSGGGISGSSLFGGLSYNWVEYKMATGSGDSAMTIYIKYDKSGTCTMRFEGTAASQMPGGGTTIDCSSTGKSQSNPNQLASDAQVSCSPISEQVTVPAGSFTTTKCTVTSQGTTATTWVVPGKYMAKMESTTSQGTVDMVLNAYG